MKVNQSEYVQLDINSTSPFQSTISITDENGVETSNYKVVGNSKLLLGSLDQLKDSVMNVTTNSRYNTFVNYDISYGNQIVKSEQASRESFFSFHFCPFFPFCD